MSEQSTTHTTSTEQEVHRENMDAIVKKVDEFFYHLDDLEAADLSHGQVEKTAEGGAVQFMFTGETTAGYMAGIGSYREFEIVKYTDDGHTITTRGEILSSLVEAESVARVSVTKRSAKGLPTEATELLSDKDDLSYVRIDDAFLDVGAELLK